MEEDYNSNDEGSFNDEDDLSLPKATITKLIQEMLPIDIACSKESRDLLISCCVEFIQLLSSESNSLCEKENRRTIAPDHIIQGLKNLGFDSYLPEVQSFYEQYQDSIKSREAKKGPKLDNSGMTEEELQKQQEELFEKAKQKYLAQHGTIEP